MTTPTHSQRPGPIKGDTSQPLAQGLPGQIGHRQFLIDRSQLLYEPEPPASGGAAGGGDAAGRAAGGEGCLTFRRG